MKNADNSAMTLNKKSIKEHRAIMIKSFLKNKLAVAGLIIVVVMVLAAVLAPVITKYDPYEMDIQNRLAAPGNGHLFGTDTFGRDVFSRVIYGLRISLYVGFAIAIIAMVFGLIIGLLSAYFPKADVVLMRICEAMMSIPATLMAIAMMAALGAKTENVIISLSIIYMPTIAKIARASALSVKEMSYIEAIKAQGASWMRIIFRHIAPNVMSPVIVQTTFIFASAIIVESSLSFIGVGVPQPTPSLGNILSEARSVIYNSWWMTLYPGIVMILTVLGINILGDGIRDIIDPT